MEFKRPKILYGFTEKVKTGFGNLYVTVNYDDNNHPIEIFATVGKSGKSTEAKTEAIGRLASICLQNGVSPEEIINQLKDIEGESPTMCGNELIKSIPDAVAKVLGRSYLIRKGEITNEEERAS